MVHCHFSRISAESLERLFAFLWTSIVKFRWIKTYKSFFVLPLWDWEPVNTLLYLNYNWQDRQKLDSGEKHKLNNKGEYLKVLTDDLHNAEANLLHSGSKWAQRCKGFSSDWHQTSYFLSDEMRGRQSTVCSDTCITGSSYSVYNMTIAETEQTGGTKISMGKICHKLKNTLLKRQIFFMHL